MFQATMCSSSGGQMYENNFWYDHSVLVAVRYEGPRQSWTPDDGRRDRPKHVECCTKIKYIWDIVHLVGFTTEKSPTVDTVAGTTLGHRSYTNKALFHTQTRNYRLQFWCNKTDKYYTKICSWTKICGYKMQVYIYRTEEKYWKCWVWNMMFFLKTQ